MASRGTEAKDQHVVAGERPGPRRPQMNSSLAERLNTYRGEQGGTLLADQVADSKRTMILTVGEDTVRSALPPAAGGAGSWRGCFEGRFSNTYQKLRYLSTQQFHFFFFRTSPT